MQIDLYACSACICMLNGGDLLKNRNEYNSTNAQLSHSCYSDILGISIINSQFVVSHLFLVVFTLKLKLAFQIFMES